MKNLAIDTTNLHSLPILKSNLIDNKIETFVI